MTRQTGKVKWYDVERGYGFILLDTKNHQLFVDWAHIRKAQFNQMSAPLASDDRLPKALFEGQDVSFDLANNNGRLRATNVDVICPRAYSVHHPSYILSTTPCNTPASGARTPSTAQNTPHAKSFKKIDLSSLLGI